MNEEALFHLALEQPAAERPAFLDKACASDDALRQRVAALLHAADNPDGLFGQVPVPLGATVDEAPPSDGLGSRIGPYKLLQQIGEGGMGTVFMAEQQEPVRRLVALKVIKLGMDSHQVIARFEAERQALALMDHPNIARVLDAGTTDSGRPYFVMELVKGVPLTKYCDEHKLSPRQRLELFVPICRAVQHAHQKGIIHRDLKPSNVLVALYDGKPVPKVIDFGIAKATGQKLTDKTLFTGFGSVVGTLEYMSPEQAELNHLDVDTRADIYSLGVLLYELLTGTTPLDRKRLRTAALLESLRLIREEEPPKPSTRLSTAQGAAIAAKRGLEPKKLSGLVRGDLDWIVMKCLEKDRDRRYDTANGLAADVQRYLTDEPVLASPPSAAYRFRKFARRHKAGLRTTAAVLVVALLAAGGVGWALWDRAAQQAERRFEQAQRCAETERAVSVALARAEQLAEQARVLPSATSVEAAAVLVVWRQADDALAPAGTALSTGAPDDGLRGRVALLRAQLEQGRQQTERGWARALRKEQLFRELDEARMARAALVDNDLDYKTAATKYAAAFAAFGLEVEGENTDELARQIGAAEPEVRDALIVALDDWTFAALSVQTEWSATKLGALAQAVDKDAWRQRYRAARTANDRAALRELSTKARRSTLPPTSLLLLARSLSLRGEHDEALALLRWGRGRHPADFWIHSALGGYLVENRGGPPTQMEVEEAIGCFRAALALRPTTSFIHNDLGVALRAGNQLDEAIAEYRQAINLDPKFADAHTNLGLALKTKNQLDEAIAEYRQAIKIDPKDAGVHTNLGNALRVKNQLDEAITEYRQAININPKDARAHTNLGIALTDKNQLDEAIAEYRQAINLDPKFAGVHNNLGNALKVNNQLDEAIAEYRQAIILDPKFADAHNNLGSALHVKNQLDEAIAEHRQAIILDPKVASHHFNFGLTLHAKNYLPQAIAEYRQAINLDPKLVEAHYNLGNVLRDRNQLDEAIAEYRQAIDLKPAYGEAYCNLASVLRLQGQFSASLDFYQRGHALGSKRTDWRFPSAQWVAHAERLVRLEAKLPDVLAGKATPADNGERLGLLEVCQLQRRYAAVARLFADAFTADVKLADDLKAGHRYKAACAAVLAAAGRAADADKLDDQERTRLRQQGLDWLHADFDLWSNRLKNSKPEDRKAVQTMLQNWQRDPQLADVRNPAALKKLPPEEQEAWRKLWTDVAALVKQAGDTK